MHLPGLIISLHVMKFHSNFASFSQKYTEGTKQSINSRGIEQIQEREIKKKISTVKGFKEIL